jgi:hypothetical protein
MTQACTEQLSLLTISDTSAVKLNEAVDEANEPLENIARSCYVP